MDLLGGEGGLRLLPWGWVDSGVGLCFKSVCGVVGEAVKVMGWT